MITENQLRTKLKDLRQRAGMTEAEVASRLGKSGNSYINRIENGPTKINIEIIDELCALYKIKPVHLFEENNTPQLKKGFFEKSVFRGITELDDTVKEKVREHLPTLRKIGRLQEILGKEPVTLQDVAPNFGEINMSSPFAAQKQAREAAIYTRKFFNIDQNSNLDITAFTWNYLNIPLCGLDLGSNCWGMFSTDKIGTPLIIYSNSHEFKQRNVFTIAHELGHYFFNHDQLTLDCDNDKDSITEKVANTFAQELLVPSATLRQVYDDQGLSLVGEIGAHHVVSLCNYFKVSFFMMILCLRQINKIKYEKYIDLRDFCLNRLEHEGSRLGYDPAKYFSDSKPLKDQLKELTLVALRKDLIGLLEASKLLDEPESKIKASL